MGLPAHSQPSILLLRFVMPTWDESKRRRNIRIHGLDFEGADAIWDGFTITREDTRERYPEERFVTFGELNGVVVVLVHADRDGDMHVISLRKAERYETRYYLEAAQDSLGEAD
jgi:uncharacterized protein